MSFAGQKALCLNQIPKKEEEFLRLNEGRISNILFSGDRHKSFFSSHLSGLNKQKRSKGPHLRWRRIMLMFISSQLQPEGRVGTKALKRPFQQALTLPQHRRHHHQHTLLSPGACVSWLLFVETVAPYVFGAQAAPV